MFLRLLMYHWLAILVECTERQYCLTGYMTDVQKWVDQHGVFTEYVDENESIDVSETTNAVSMLRQKITSLRYSEQNQEQIRYLSMARCGLNMVPPVFNITNTRGYDLAGNIEYMTFYGNRFQELSQSGEMYDEFLNATGAVEDSVSRGLNPSAYSVLWSTGFNNTFFPRLKELDLRACSIQSLGAKIFQGMPNLEALYIGENEVKFIDSIAFVGLTKLIHLDFSQNQPYYDRDTETFSAESLAIFEPLENLASLDLSYTTLLNRNAALLNFTTHLLTRLSICYSGITSLNSHFFSHTSLRIMDLSGNNGVLSKSTVLHGLNDTLEVLYAKETNLKSIEVLRGFSELQILDLTSNEIHSITAEIAQTWKNLQVLYLDRNRYKSWFSPTFCLMHKLELLSLKNNNLNTISQSMVSDLANVNFVALSGNSFVCNCHARDFFDIALKSEKTSRDVALSGNTEPDGHLHTNFHTAFMDSNQHVNNREIVQFNCSDVDCDSIDRELHGHFLLLDYDPLHYSCLQDREFVSLKLFEVAGCHKIAKEKQNPLADGLNLLYVLMLVPSLFIVLGVIVLRRNLRYCMITIKNSAMLSLINKDEVFDEGMIYHYDVFVSYCNEDRNWVLDHLLPHLETECSVSVCLHERDFQVGLSILENIVSCMDRSRSIMLIISQRFLLSQWCQFEMHLAQHRLLETRRENLTLVLLEDIPRRLRPNTLHYLMLTKTYIVWPKVEAERTIFWKRLKKPLLNVKMKQMSESGVTLA